MSPDVFDIPFKVKLSIHSSAVPPNAAQYELFVLVTVNDSVAVQPLTSVTVTVYELPVISPVAELLAPNPLPQLYVKFPAPPVGVAVAVPLIQSALT